MIETDAVLSRFLPLHPKRIDLRLDRIERLLAALGSPEKHLPPVIHVAGTNGKGSTIAFMRAILEAAGRRAHVYTSPYLVRFHERIRLGHAGGGRLVDDERLMEAFDACERANAGEPISLFEITTAAAFWLFSRTPADYLLLEVGLGGRYDATNVIERPLATVATSISMDHVEFLGDTIEKIAFEKAGIFKPGVPAIISPQGSEAALRVLEREARRIGAPLTIAGRDFHVHEEHGRLVYEDADGLLDLPPPRLAGRHQFANAATAIAALRAAAPELPMQAYGEGLGSAYWPARLQALTRGTIVDLAPWDAEIWLDGGHNADGGRVLAEAMADFEERSSRPLVLLCGMQTTKDTSAFLAAFQGLAQELIAVPVDSPAGRPPTDVAARASEVGLRAVACDGIVAGLDYLAAREWPTPPRILITGSLYLAGEVLRVNGTPPE